MKNEFIGQNFVLVKIKGVFEMERLIVFHQTHR